MARFPHFLLPWFSFSKPRKSNHEAFGRRLAYNGSLQYAIGQYNHFVMKNLPQQQNKVKGP
jgi:hypothetical protein